MTMVLKEVHDIREKCPLTLFENHSKKISSYYVKYLLQKQEKYPCKRENLTERFLCDFQTSFARP